MGGLGSRGDRGMGGPSMSLGRVPGLEVTQRTTLEELAVILDALQLRVHVSRRRGRWEALAFRTIGPETIAQESCSGAGETIADALSAAISEACEGSA
jgi:hypothetical protein